MAEIYAASPVKRRRRRATNAEMEERAKFLIAYAEEHGPTVRGLYYQAEVAGIAGIDKDDKSYSKIQRGFLNSGAKVGSPMSTSPMRPMDAEAQILQWSRRCP